MSAQTIEKYRIIAQIPGGYVLIHKKENNIAVYKTVLSSFDQRNTRKLIVERQRIQHANLINIIDFSILDLKSSQSDESNNFQTKSTIIYEGWNMDLEDDILQRQQESSYFEEEELFFEMGQAISALQILHNNDLVHGDIKPNNIAYCEQKKGQIKLVDQFGFGENSFLAPEILDNIDECNEMYATKANDIFALGIVFLDAVTLGQCKNLYNWDHKTFDNNLLANIFYDLKLKYSENLYKTLQLMCEIDPSLRADTSQLLEFWKTCEVSYDLQNTITENFSLSNTLNPQDITYKNVSKEPINNSLANHHHQEADSPEFANVFKKNKMQTFNNKQTKQTYCLQNSFNRNSFQSNQDANDNNTFLQGFSKQNLNTSYENRNTFAFNCEIQKNSYKQENNYNTVVSDMCGQNQKSKQFTYLTIENKQLDQSIVSTSDKYNNEEILKLSNMLDKCLTETQNLILQNKTRRPPLQPLNLPQDLRNSAARDSKFTQSLQVKQQPQTQYPQKSTQISFETEDSDFMTLQYRTESNKCDSYKNIDGHALNQQMNQNSQQSYKDCNAQIIRQENINQNQQPFDEEKKTLNILKPQPIQQYQQQLQAQINQKENQFKRREIKIEDSERTFQGGICGKDWKWCFLAGLMQDFEKN